MVGQTFLHYRVLEKLGEGGMGVVYKAEDTQLRRTVALKFLSKQALGDQDHKARLIREAQAAAALDHPNICAVHGIHEENGETFIAMAFVEGPNLAAKIEHRPLAFEEALKLAIQLGEGLQEAHENGVVHRDIKPANLMLTRKGQIKIMDFGLAYLSDRSKLTKSGTTMGTPCYMSPEQALGQTTDRRSDIWSLGVVLYEMLAGKPPFDGQYEQAIVYSILNEEPEPLTALRTGLPVEIDRIIGKVLAKRPEERYQHVDEMLVDLRACLKPSVGRVAAATPTAAQAEIRREVPAAPKARQRVLWMAAGILLGLALALVAARLWRASPEPETIAFAIDIGTDPAEEFVAAPALSYDGRSIAFVAQDESGREKLWLRRLDSSSARSLAGTDGAHRPFWSPDGRLIAFFAGGQLKKIDPAGGPAIAICEAGVGLGGAWGPGGEIIFAPSYRTPLHRVPAAGGSSTPITALHAERGENSHRWPQFLPDGRHFLFTTRAVLPENTMLSIGSLDSKEVKQLFSVESNVRFAPAGSEQTGYLLFARRGALIAQRFDALSLELQGEPVGVAEGALHIEGSVLADFSVSGNGEVLLYNRGSGLRQLAWFDRNGRRLASLGPPRDQFAPRISPDGKQITVSLPDTLSSNLDVWLIDAASGAPRRLTLDPSKDWNAAWSPDGTRIAFTSERKAAGVSGLYQRSASSGGEEEVLLDQAAAPSDWSPDGKFVAFESFGAKEDDDLWLVPLEGPREPISVLKTKFEETDAHFSPDGRWIAYTSNESGSYEVYVRASPKVVSGVEPKIQGAKQVSTSGGAGARWRRDGGELFYLTPDHMLMVAEVKPGDEIEISAPKPLFKTCDSVFWTRSWQSTYDPAADGQRFLFNCPVETSSQAEVVIHWTSKIQNGAAPR